MRKFLTMIVALLVFMLGSALALAEANLFAWTFEPHGEGSARARAAVPTADGGLFVVGETNSQDDLFGKAHGGLDAIAVCLGADGNVLWQYRLGGTADDRFTHALELQDGRFLAMGTTTSTDGDARASRGGMDVFLALFSQEGTLEFTKLLGGSMDDEMLDICQTADGAVILAGRTQSRNGDLTSNMGGNDAWITRISLDDGKPLWKDRFGDALEDSYNRLLPVADGVLVTGVADRDEANDIPGNPIAMQYTTDGKRVVEEPVRLSTASTGESSLLSITQGRNGWVLLGQTNVRSAMLVMRGGSDIWLLNLRPNGNVSWQYTFGGSKNDRPYQLIPAESDGYLILCVTDSSDGQVTGAHGEDDLWVLRVNAQGQLQWEQTLGGSARSIPAGIALTPVGNNILVAGTSLSQDGDIGTHSSVRTGFLSLLEPNGNLMWTELVGDGAEMTLQQLLTRDGAAFLVGSVRDVGASGLSEHFYIARLSPDIFPE